jgi:hypothetical protein
MKNSLLNSIYSKKTPSKNFDDLLEFYVDKIFIMYLNALEDAGISNVDEKIKVKQKYLGKMITVESTGGDYATTIVFDTNEFQDAIDKLDKIFLDHCEFTHKKDILDTVKYLLREVGCHTADKSDWLEVLKTSNLENEIFTEEENLMHEHAKYDN